MKIKVEELTAIREHLAGQIQTINEDLQDVSAKMVAVPQTEGFKGTAQKNILSYTQRVHQKETTTITTDLNDLLQEYNRLLEQFAQGVDNSPTAVINTDYLHDIQQQFHQAMQQLNVERQQMNRAISMAADEGANVSPLDSGMDRAIQESIQFISRLVNAMEQFNGTAVSSKVADIEHSAIKVQSVVNNLDGFHANGKSRFAKLHSVKDFSKKIQTKKKHKSSSKRSHWLASLLGINMIGFGKNKSHKKGFISGSLAGGGIHGISKQNIKFLKFLQLNNYLTVDAISGSLNFKAGNSKKFKGAKAGFQTALFDSTAKIGWKSKLYSGYFSRTATFASFKTGAKAYLSKNTGEIGFNANAVGYSKGFGFGNYTNVMGNNNAPMGFDITGTYGEQAGISKDYKFQNIKDVTWPIIGNYKININHLNVTDTEGIKLEGGLVMHTKFPIYYTYVSTE